MHLRWDSLTDEQRRQFVDVIDQQAQRMQRLLTDLSLLNSAAKGAWTKSQPKPEAFLTRLFDRFTRVEATASRSKDRDWACQSCRTCSEPKAATSRTNPTSLKDLGSSFACPRLHKHHHPLPPSSVSE